MSRLLIYGNGGVGREILAPARIKAAAAGIADVLFVSDQASGGELDGTPVVQFDEAQRGDRYIIAVADGRAREKIDRRCVEAGLEPWTLLAPDVAVGVGMVIGAGALVNWQTVIAGYSQIGRQFQCHGKGYVAHDCVIGDYVTFGVQVVCNGNIHIGDHAYIGTGAILRSDTPHHVMSIGAGASIGTGAIVTRDVPPGAVVTRHD